ncbi:class I SAM-dependent methyltransferase [Enterococcus sp. LJL98]
MGNTDEFEKMARKYDTAERVEVAKVIATAIRQELNDTKDKTAMDFGCGTGLVGLELIGNLQSILFVDTSANMLEVVTEKLHQQEILNGAVKCFDFENNEPFKEKVDVIFMSQVLLHIKDPISLLKRLYHVLNNQGQLLIVDFDKNKKVDSDLVHNGFVQEDLRQELIALGFEEVMSKTFYTQEALFMGQNASLFLMQGEKNRFFINKG